MSWPSWPVGPARELSPCSTSISAEEWANMQQRNWELWTHWQRQYLAWNQHFQFSMYAPSDQAAPTPGQPPLPPSDQHATKPPLPTNRRTLLAAPFPNSPTLPLCAQTPQAQSVSAQNTNFGGVHNPQSSSSSRPDQQQMPTNNGSTSHNIPGINLQIPPPNFQSPQTPSVSPQTGKSYPTRQRPLENPVGVSDVRKNNVEASVTQTQPLDQIEDFDRQFKEWEAQTTPARSVSARNTNFGGVQNPQWSSSSRPDQQQMPINNGNTSHNIPGINLQVPPPNFNSPQTPTVSPQTGISYPTRKRPLENPVGVSDVKKNNVEASVTKTQLDQIEDFDRQFKAPLAQRYNSQINTQINAQLSSSVSARNTYFGGVQNPQSSSSSRPDQHQMPTNNGTTSHNIPGINLQVPPPNFKSPQTPTVAPQTGKPNPSRKRPFENPVGVSDAKKNNLEASVTNTQLLDQVEDFDRQFKAWEAQFTQWKEENAVHSEKQQYKEYEAQWESWRAQLVERRKLMFAKKPNAAAPSSDTCKSEEMPTDGAVSATQTSNPYNGPEKIEDIMSSPKEQRTNIRGRHPVDQDIKVDFLKPEHANGIPGLDLVNKADAVKTPERNLDGLTAGLNSILGDENLLFFLSRISKNQKSTTDSSSLNSSNQLNANVQNTQSPLFPISPDDPYVRENCQSNHSNTQNSLSRSPFANPFDQCEAPLTIGPMCPPHCLDGSSPVQGAPKNGKVGVPSLQHQLRELGIGGDNETSTETNKSNGNQGADFDEVSECDRNSSNLDSEKVLSIEIPGPSGDFMEIDHPNHGHMSQARNEYDSLLPNRDNPNGSHNTYFEPQLRSGFNRFGPTSRVSVDQEITDHGRFEFRGFGYNRNGLSGRCPTGRVEPENNHGSFDQYNTIRNGNIHSIEYPSMEHVGEPADYTQFWQTREPPDFSMQVENRWEQPRDYSQVRCTREAPENCSQLGRRQEPLGDYSRVERGRVPPEHYSWTVSRRELPENYNQMDRRREPPEGYDRMDHGREPPHNSIQIGSHFNPMNTCQPRTCVENRANGSIHFGSLYSHRNPFDHVRRSLNRSVGRNELNSHSHINTGPHSDSEGFFRNYVNLLRVGAGLSVESVRERQAHWDEAQVLKPEVVVDYGHIRKKEGRPFEPKIFDYQHKSRSTADINNRTIPERPAEKPIKPSPQDTEVELINSNSRADQQNPNFHDTNPDFYPRPPPFRRYNHHHRDYYHRSDQFDNHNRNDWNVHDSRRTDDRRAHDSKRTDDGKVDTNNRPDTQLTTERDEESVSQNKKDENVENLDKPTPVMMIDDILSLAGRATRASRIAIILRGPPGSGKTVLAKLIKDKEVEHGGSAPRILSLDDYYMVEIEKVVEDETGRRTVVKKMVYEFEKSMKSEYRRSLDRVFKKTVTDGFFNFIILDCVNNKLKHYADMWSFAKQNGFQVYVCQLQLDVANCAKRNTRGFTEAHIQKMVDRWEPTPVYQLKIDVTSLMQSECISVADRQEITQPMEYDKEDKEDQLVVSKWEKMDTSDDKLARLDGTSKPLRQSTSTMEDYLQLEAVVPELKPGEKRVRWADLEEKRRQDKIRAIGFVVGQTDWDSMIDPTQGSSALTQTKYIEETSQRF